MLSTKARLKVVCLGDRFSLIQLSPRSAYITKALKRPGKGGRLARIQSAYFGFDNYDSAIKFAKRLPKAVVRFSKRLETVYEVKAHNLTDGQIWELSQQMLSEPTLTPAPSAPPAPSSNYSLVIAASDNCYQRYEIYDGRKLIGSIQRATQTSGWTFRGNLKSWKTREDAADALIARKAAEQKTHEDCNAAILSRFF